MGPICILDKSTIQRLTWAESVFAQRYYSANIPHILLIEILADIRKKTKRGAVPEDLARSQAAKLVGTDFKVIANYRGILFSSLLGSSIPLRAEFIPPRMYRFTDSKGKLGLFVPHQPENEALNRWSARKFSEGERILASSWREAMKEPNLEVLKRRLRHAGVEVPVLTGFDEISDYLESLSSTPEFEDQKLRWILDEASFSRRQAKAVLDLWRQHGSPSLFEFSEYGEFFFRVSLGFYLAILSDLIGTRATNRLDLQYLYYLPFCHIFVSADSLHEELVQPFLRDDQEFIHADEIKADLSGVATKWEALPDENKPQYASSLGHVPPEELDLTVRMWDKYMSSDWRDGRNKSINLTPDQERRLVEEVRQKFEDAKKQIYGEPGTNDLA